jgi:hypothetical protein
VPGALLCLVRLVLGRPCRTASSALDALLYVGRQRHRRSGARSTRDGSFLGGAGRGRLLGFVGTVTGAAVRRAAGVVVTPPSTC